MYRSSMTINKENIHFKIQCLVTELYFDTSIITKVIILNEIFTVSQTILNDLCHVSQDVYFIVHQNARSLGDEETLKINHILLTEILTENFRNMLRQNIVR